MSGYVFVGERQSPTAAARGWTWESGRACAATLHAALSAVGIDAAHCAFVNLWQAPGLGRPAEPARVEPVRELAARGYTIVALGGLVSGALTEAGIPHVRLRHPAARGALRARPLYQAHVAAVLGGAR